MPTRIPEGVEVGGPEVEGVEGFTTWRVESASAALFPFKEGLGDTSALAPSGTKSSGAGEAAGATTKLAGGGTLVEGVLALVTGGIFDFLRKQRRID